MNNTTGIASTPPMGWNSWDCYAATVNEEQLLGNAEYMAKHLKRFGWEYVVCDIQWSDPKAGTGSGEYIPFTRLTLDAYGRQLPAENRFPSAAGGRGFGPIADKIHALGLKFGVHLMRGIPRQAAHGRLPILGTDATADQAANPFSISKWNADMYGVLGNPAGQAYYDSVFALLAEWGVDFVKVDDICNTNMYPHDPYSAKREIEMTAQAIRGCGRPMALSLSPGPALTEQSWHLRRYASMWRMTDDFWDAWRLLKDMFRRCEVWEGIGGPGGWPDCDMLPLGKLRIGFHNPGWTRFTREEQRTMLTLWCVFRSPLMMGGEMRDNDAWTLSLLTNAGVLRVLNHTSGGRQLFLSENEAAWASRDEDGSEYLALFNLSDDEREVRAGSFDKTALQYEELWGRNGLLTGPSGAKLPAHGCALIKYSF